MVKTPDISKLKKEIERLRKLVYYDELTGVLNRRGFKEEAEKVFTPAFPSGANGHHRKAISIPFCVLFMDLDNFKRVNDTFGHDIGDEVLRAMSKALNDTLRENDIIGRWGGEEFIVALYGARVKTAQKIAERIRSAIEKINIKVGGKRIPVSASIGLASHNKEKDMFELVQNADMAMYQAKRKGKNRVVVFSQSADNNSWLSDRAKELKNWFKL